MDIDTVDRECLISSNGQTSFVFDNQLVDYDEFDDLDDFETQSLNDDDSGEVDDSFIPKVGMLFSTPEEAFTFYNRYAFKMGFGTRKSSTSVSKTEKSKIVGRKFVCDKEGKRKRYCEKYTDIHTSHSRETRVGFKAMMWIRLNELGSWDVSNFVAQHNNHELSTPSKAVKHRSHKRIHRQEAVKKLITQFHDTGLPNASIAKAVNTFEPNLEHTITSQQVHDHLRKQRKSNLGKNCAIVINHFMNKKAKDPGFFFNIELDDDCTLRSVFWADRRSQESYKKFSDVIVFDVTYRTNNFSLPFAPFTGINHHYQSTLFGCALLADETEETFVWLFEQWLKCMEGEQPGVIITDQDAAMGNAIARIFPNTLHQYCDWHLQRNIGENLVHLKAIHGPDIELDFNKLQSSDSVDDAEKCWNDLMSKHNLREKSWLPKLWERRRSWLPCYLKDTFVAGTRSSQRSESMNAYFDAYVTSSTPLHEFVLQYDKALASRRKAEEDADFKTMNTKPVFLLGWPLEEDAGKRYTSTMFDRFHTQMKDSVSYWAEEEQNNGTITLFKVGRPNTNKSKWKLVTYDSAGVFVSCQCKHFEKVGLLCKHALCILWKKQILKIPDRYILKRWTIEARYQHVEIRFDNDISDSEVDRELLWGLRYNMNKVLEEAFKSPAFAKEMNDLITKKLAYVSLRAHDSQVEPPISKYLSNINPEITIRDPTGVAKTKGRPRQATRIQSSLEISQEDESKKRTCGFCKEKGHYRTGCSKAKEMERRLMEQNKQ